MKVAITADLHYGRHPTQDRAVRALAERIAAHAPDVLLIVGDVAVADPRASVECLRLFSEVAPHRFVLPGNHDLWTNDAERGADSFTIWDRLFSEAVRLGGFHRLDRQPVVLDEIGFVGSIGWYDYSFADPRLNIPRECYVRKELPGVARWNDGRFIRWKWDDPGFTRLVVAHLRQDIEAVRTRAVRIIAAVHHVPFEALLTRHSHRGWMFHNAFMGSRLLGEVLLAEPKVALCVCGHTHQARTARVGHILAVNVGAGYTHKRAVLYGVAPEVLHAVAVEQVRAGQ